MGQTTIYSYCNARLTDQVTLEADRKGVSAFASSVFDSETGEIDQCSTGPFPIGRFLDALKMLTLSGQARLKHDGEMLAFSIVKPGYVNISIADRQRQLDFLQLPLEVDQLRHRLESLSRSKPGAQDEDERGT